LQDLRVYSDESSSHGLPGCDVVGNQCHPKVPASSVSSKRSLEVDTDTGQGVQEGAESHPDQQKAGEDPTTSLHGIRTQKTVT